MTQGHHGGSSARPARRRTTVRPRLTPLEDRAVPSITNPLDTGDVPAPPTTTTPPPAIVTPIVAVGADAGNMPYVRVIDTATGQTKFTFFAYEKAFRGGVRVATGDVNGDGVADIVTAPGIGGGPLIKVWDGATGSMLNAFLAYDASFRGGVYLAVGDVNGDGHADIVTGAGEGGGPHVRVFNGAWAIPPFHIPPPIIPVTPAPLPVEPPPNEIGGPTTTTGDGSTTTPGDDTTVVVGDGSTTTTTGDGTTTTTGDGSTTTTGDGSTTTTGDGSTTTTGDGSTTTTTGDPVVEPPAVLPPPLDTTTEVLSEFMAYDMHFRGGVRVAAGDVNGDGKADIITGAGMGGGPHVRIFDSTTGQVYREFMAFASTFTGGVYVTAGDVDGDGKAEVAVSSGLNGGARVNMYSGDTGRPVRTFSANPENPTSAVRVRMVDYDHDGNMDLLAVVGQTVQVRDPLTNTLKSAFTPLDQQNLGTVNLG